MRGWWLWGPRVGNDVLTDEFHPDANIGAAWLAGTTLLTISPSRLCDYLAHHAARAGIGATASQLLIDDFHNDFHNPQSLRR